MILVCNCKNEQQDKFYGKGCRVHNQCKGTDGKFSAARCTVCGEVKQGAIKILGDKL